MSESVLKPPPHTAPTAFTRAQLDWLPWLEPLAAEAMTPRHMASPAAATNTSASSIAFMPGLHAISLARSVGRFGDNATRCRPKLQRHPSN